VESNLKLTKIQTWLAVIVAVLSIGGTAIGLGLGVIEEAVAMEAAQREEADLETRIEAITVELEYLESKSPKSPNDIARMKYLNIRLEIYLRRLQELQQ
jgi:hypothetical protein